MPVTYPPETVSQTSGPFLHIGLMPRVADPAHALAALGADVAGPDADGERIAVTGRVLDGLGAPVRDMVIESWQADARGIHASPEDPRHAEVSTGFRGFGRVATDGNGAWTLETIKPGPVPGPHGRTQAPHLSLWLLARGLTAGLATRLYFDDEPEANEGDAVLGLIDPAARARTLLARRVEPGRYAFDIHLQGPHETVFLDA